MRPRCTATFVVAATERDPVGHQLTDQRRAVRTGVGARGENLLPPVAGHRVFGRRQRDLAAVVSSEQGERAAQQLDDVIRRDRGVHQARVVHRLRRVRAVGERRAGHRRHRPGSGEPDLRSLDGDPDVGARADRDPDAAHRRMVGHADVGETRRPQSLQGKGGARDPDERAHPLRQPGPAGAEHRDQRQASLDRMPDGARRTRRRPPRRSCRRGWRSSTRSRPRSGRRCPRSRIAVPVSPAVRWSG